MSQTLTIETVTRKRTVGGVATTSHVAVAGIPTGHRVARRWTDAHRVGLEYVRALGVPDGEHGVTYVAVLDSQRRVLAAWRRMADLPGFTGTHDKHPLIGNRSPLWRRGS